MIEDNLQRKEVEDMMKQAVHMACSEYTAFAPMLVSCVQSAPRGQNMDTKIILFHADFGVYEFHLTVMPPFIRVDHKETLMEWKAHVRRVMDKFVANSVKWYGGDDARGTGI